MSIDPYYLVLALARVAGRGEILGQKFRVVSQAIGQGEPFLETHAQALYLAPRASRIMKVDLFDWQLPTGIGGIAVIGKPLFGRVAALMSKFFNYLVKFAGDIAFILPTLATEVSMFTRRSDRLHEIVLPDETCELTLCARPL